MPLSLLIIKFWRVETVVLYSRRRIAKILNRDRKMHKQGRRKDRKIAERQEEPLQMM